MRLQLPFHSYRHLARPVSSARLVNCYAETVPQDGKNLITLRAHPGVKAFATVGTGPIRAACMHAGLLYVVSGARLYSVSAGGTVVERGTVGGAGLPADMASNGLQLVIVSQPDGYVFEGVTLTQITDTDFTSRGATACEFLDSYILFIEPDSGRFFASELLEANDYDALNFATAEGAPDNLVGMVVDHRQVILGGEDSIELWANVGGDGFPFARFDNGFIECGVKAGRSMAKDKDNSVMWLDDKGIVRRLEGTTPLRISTHAVEQAISAYTNPEDAVGHVFPHQGHLFYVLDVPDEGTWAYDLATSEWHELQSYGRADWQVKGTIQAYGRVFAWNDSNLLGEIDEDTHTEWGAIQRMEWTYPTVYADGRRAFHKRLEIIMQTGIGLTSGQGSAPEIGLDISDDGGMTYVPHINLSIGTLGQYRQKVTWHGLGSSENRVYRPWISDPVRRTIIDTQLDAEGARL